jgi:hypothetical protein
LGLYSLAFIIDGLKTALNASQKDYTYREVLKGFCHIKVLKVFWTTANCLGNIGVRDIKEAGECFTYIRRRGIIHIIVAYFKGSVRLAVILRLLKLSGTILRLC